MTDSDHDALRAAAEGGDAEAMRRLAEELEMQARRLRDESRDWFWRAYRGGSLDAVHGLVRSAVADRDYQEANRWLREAQLEFPDADPRRLVSISPKVLGLGISLEGDDADDVPGAGTFTIITPFARRAAVALAEVAPRLLHVDERGQLQPLPDTRSDDDGIPYTPNYVDDIKWRYGAAIVSLDTKGMMTSAMGRTMVGILVEALVAAAIPAHVAGYLPELHTELSVVEVPQG